MARHETRTGVCFPGTGLGARREPESRAPMFGNKLKHRKETDTMKSYILLPSEPVQSQITIAPAGTRPPVLFISAWTCITIRLPSPLAPSDSTEVRRYGSSAGTRRRAQGWSRNSSGPSGNAPEVLLRSRAAGICAVPLPAGTRVGLHISLPLEGAAQTGERVKTDRRDADQLARLYRAGELTGIYVPDRKMRRCGI